MFGTWLFCHFSTFLSAHEACQLEGERQANSKQDSVRARRKAVMQPTGRKREKKSFNP